MADPRASSPQIELCSFSDILPAWRDELWPERSSLIEPLSMISRDGSINMELAEIGSTHPPIFFQVRGAEGACLGTIQGQWTKKNEMRLRGVWTHPALRGQGWGKRLIQTLTSHARPDHLWVMSRESAVPFYTSCGLREYTRITGYEYGPHILMDRTF